MEDDYSATPSWTKQLVDTYTAVRLATRQDMWRNPKLHVAKRQHVF